MVPEFAELTRQVLPGLRAALGAPGRRSIDCIRESRRRRATTIYQVKFAAACVRFRILLDPDGRIHSVSSNRTALIPY